MKSTVHLVPSEPQTTHSNARSHPLIVVVGPTGSGKSKLGVKLARYFDGEIVSCDSIQVYRGLDIGSAKIPIEERQGIPHHLLDVIDVGHHDFGQHIGQYDPGRTGAEQELTAGAYANLSRQSLKLIGQRNKLPIVVGGTGLYLRALLDGLSPAPARDEALRRRLTSLAQRRPQALHRFLRRADPAAAGRIHPNDHQKLIRAIELTISAEKPASAIQSLPRDALQEFSALKIGLAPDRGLLYEHLNRRSRDMFREGLLAETSHLLASGVPPNSKPLSSLGYKQAVQVLTQGQPLESAIAECQTRTRQYAKRQLTWFRADTAVNWLPGFGEDGAIEAQAIVMVNRFLAGDSWNPIIESQSLTAARKTKVPLIP